MTQGRQRNRRFQVFTCDRGRRLLDVDRAPETTTRWILQEVVESGFWRELDKFPTDVIALHLPYLVLSPHTRRLLEIWIEERSDDKRVA
jgi:hypothetical protein